MRTLPTTLCWPLLAAATLPAQAATTNICDRTPQVRDAILKEASTDDCAAVDLTGVYKLLVNNKALTSLEAEDFDGLTKVRGLVLNDNQLTTLPEGLFDGLSSLRTLELRHNQLTTLPEDLFDGLSSLAELFLGNNQLTTLPEGLFDGLGNLLLLVLNNNQLTTLPEGLFDDLVNLRNLYLENNQLTTLPNFVHGLNHLQALLLHNNQLTTLPAGVFDILGNLRQLNLSNNQLTALPEGVFDELVVLRLLNLQNNHLVGLTRDDPLFARLGSRGEISILLGGQTEVETETEIETTDICDRTPQVRDVILQVLEADDCAAVDLTGVDQLFLDEKQLTSLKTGDFDGLASLRTLWLNHNQLTTLPEGLFEGLGNLQWLELRHNQLTTLPEGVFEGLGNLQYLTLHNNQLTTLPEGVFEGLDSLQELSLAESQLTTLPEGLFDGLASLQRLALNHNQLTTLPEGLFDGLGNLQWLFLNNNQLTTLPEGLFEGLDSLQELSLNNNQLTTLPEGAFANLKTPPADSFGEPRSFADSLPAGVFDGLSSLQTLDLSYNQLATLPEGLFDGLSSLEELNLQGNHLVGLTVDDPLFDGLAASIELDGQTKSEIEDVTLMLSASHPMRQGFTRIVNESEEAGVVRVFAVDDGGYAPDPFEIQLNAEQAFHLNANDLEHGNSNKGIEGVGAPVQGDWRLDIETDLSVRMLAFVRANDDFLTAMHGVLPRDDDGQLVAMTFNPGSNDERVSKLRLVNTGDSVETVSIEGIDDQGVVAGPVSLTLAASRSRTLSASELENGVRGLTGALGDGNGKWRLFVTAGDSVAAMSLLDARDSGHLTNISTFRSRLAKDVPLMLSASHSTRQGFARIVNESEEAGVVRVFAVDDGGYAPDPFEIQLNAEQAFHLNANDLEHGNSNKGIEGVGAPVQGDWRLDIETDLSVRMLAFVRANDDFLTAMHGVLPRDDDGQLVAMTFNPGSNDERVSKLRLVNTGDSVETVSIEGIDDQGVVAGPVSLTLAASRSRTLSASELENGVRGLTGALGDGNGKWRLFVTAGDSVAAMSLLDARESGHLTNISTMGVAP